MTYSKLSEPLLDTGGDAYAELRSLSNPASILADLTNLASLTPLSRRASRTPADAEPGLSFSAAALSLVKVSVGAGAMALPWATMQGGAASAPALVLLAVWNAYTAWLLLDCAPSGSFSDLARLTLGIYIYIHTHTHTYIVIG